MRHLFKIEAQQNVENDLQQRQSSPIANTVFVFVSRGSDFIPWMICISVQLSCWVAPTALWQ